MNDKTNPDRSTVRVELYFPVRWKLVKDGADLAKEIESHRTSDRFKVPPTAFTDMPTDLSELTEFQELTPHIYSMWMTLERKLDYIIREMNPELFDDPSMEKCYCTDLSAGGVLLSMDKKLDKGEELLLRIVPPTFPQFILEVIANLISVEEDTQKNGYWLARAEFSSINLADQEDLVSYVFKRQREILRYKSENPGL